MAKNIISVGIELPVAGVDYSPLSNTTSLLDWDVVIFRAGLDEFAGHYGVDEYMGKPSLDDSYSVKIVESAVHWSKQLAEAFNEGKTVIVYLTGLEEVYVATGEKRYSGTGRNQKTTRIVEKFSNYKFLPGIGEWTAAEGKRMILDPNYRNSLGAYWSQFEEYSQYCIIFDKAGKKTCIRTKSGNKAVGHIVTHETGSGRLILLPDIEFERSEFVEYDNYGELSWSEEGVAFCKSLVAAVVGLSKAVAQDEQTTPAPDWAGSDSFKIHGETQIQEKILQVDREISGLTNQRDALKVELTEVTALRALLYESGKPLEAAIISALKTIGYAAEQFEDDKSEFDAVFQSDEGRLLGEAEGKDNKQINVTKLRQLSANIHEDMEREEIDQPAKGVLFGNAFRLTTPAERGEVFTDKCVTLAASMSISLVNTVDLFAAAQYVKLSGNQDYAKEVRQAIFDSNGIISFPKVPETSEPSAIDEDVAVSES